MVLMESRDELALRERASGQGLVPKEPPAASQLLDEAADDEAEARRAAQKAVRVRNQAEQAVQKRLSAEREAKEREEAAKRCEQRAEAVRSEAERLRREAERLSREAEQAHQKSHTAAREVQRWREDEIKLNNDAQELQVVAVAAAIKAKTTFEAAAAAATEDLFGRPVPSLTEALAAHPAEEMFAYPSREEAAHADIILSRTGHNLDSHGGFARVSGVRSSWGTCNTGLVDIVQRPAGKAGMLESVDERLVVAVLQGILRGTSRAIVNSSKVTGRLPEAFLREATSCFQSRDEDSFRVVLDRLCSCSAVTADVMVGAELIRGGLSKALGKLIEEDRDGTRHFINRAFSQDVVLAGEELLEQLEQWSSEQAIVDYRQQGQQQAPPQRVRLPPPSRRTMEMHRRVEPSVYSVVQVAEGDDGWDTDDKTLFLNHVDVLSGAQSAVEDHLNQDRQRGSPF